MSNHFIRLGIVSYDSVTTFICLVLEQDHQKSCRVTDSFGQRFCKCHFPDSHSGGPDDPPRRNEAVAGSVACSTLTLLRLMIDRVACLRTRKNWKEGNKGQASPPNVKRVSRKKLRIGARMVRKEGSFSGHRAISYLARPIHIVSSSHCFT